MIKFKPGDIIIYAPGFKPAERLVVMDLKDAIDKYSMWGDNILKVSLQERFQFMCVGVDGRDIPYSFFTQHTEKCTLDFNYYFKEDLKSILE